MADQFERAILEPALADRVTTSIREVATGILSGRIQSKIVEQPYGDEETVRQYHEALKELLEIASIAKLPLVNSANPVQNTPAPEADRPPFSYARATPPPLSRRRKNR